MKEQVSGAVFETEIPGAKLIARGKVRDLYDLDDKLLLVATEGGLMARMFGMDVPAEATPRVLAELGDQRDYPAVYQVDPGSVPDADVRVFLDRLTEFGVQYKRKK